MPTVRKHATSGGRAPTAREMWLQAVKGRARESGGNKKGMSTTKKTPNEYWVGTLRRSQGLQNEIASMDTFGDNGRPVNEAKPYLSTSHYLRERVGIERAGSAKRASTGDMRAAPGTPAYKTPEEYYDEVLELRKQIGALDKDNRTLTAKLRRTEEDNLKKEKEIGNLLDPEKSGDLRRTLTDRKPDSSAVVHSLKQKVMKLEQQLRVKEQTITSLKSDVRATNLEEVRLKMEMFYQEITRLRGQRSAPENSQSQATVKSSRSVKETKESPSKIKALNDTILRMNEKNVRLTTENKSLKEDMDKLLNEVSDKREKEKDLEDMNRKQLASMVARLEKKLENQQTKQIDNMSIASNDSNRLRPDTTGKIELEGTLAQRLEQLDRRETELLEEIKQLKLSSKKIKEDRQHYRTKADEKIKEIKLLKKEVADLQAELEQLYAKDKRSPTPSRRSPGGRYSPSERRPSSGDRRPSSADRHPSSADRGTPPSGRHTSQERTPRDERDLVRERRPSSREAREKKARDEKLRQIRENRAARTIQRGWRNHKEEEEEAVEMIQATLRGNSARKKQLRRFEEEEYEDELSDAAELIQSAYRGHVSRKKYLSQRSRPSSAERESMDSEDEAATYIQSAYRGHTARKQYLNSSSRPPSARSTSSRASISRKSASSPRQLDSAGEDENISDEIITPRRGRRSSGSVKRSPRVKSRPQTSRVANDDDDDDDIMF